MYCILPFLPTENALYCKKTFRKYVTEKGLRTTQQACNEFLLCDNIFHEIHILISWRQDFILWQKWRLIEFLCFYLTEVSMKL